MSKETSKFKEPRVSVLIVFHDGKEQTIRCLESVKAIQYPDFEIIVVDDGSTDDSSEQISNLFPDVQILKGNGNLWCNGSFNLALEHCLKKSRNLFLLLNNDNIIAPNALNYLVETHLLLNAPIVGSLVSYTKQPDIVSYAGKCIDWKNGRNIAIHNLRKISEIPQELIEANFLGFQGVLISRNVLDKVGLFDEKTFKHYCCDTDFYLRAAKTGFKTIVDTRAIVWDDVDTKGPAGPSPSLVQFIRNLKSIKSIAHLPTRYRFYKRHSPVFWLRPFLRYYIGLFREQLTVMFKHYFMSRVTDTKAAQGNC